MNLLLLVRSLVYLCEYRPSSSLVDPPVQQEAPADPGYVPSLVQYDRRPSVHQAYREDAHATGRSRSASVVSSVFGRQAGQDDDISAIMMRGATDIRNAKYEIEEQVGHQDHSHQTIDPRLDFNQGDGTMVRGGYV